MKRALVLGGSRGIGLATCKAFCSSGYEVLSVARTKASTANESLRFFEADLADENSRDTLKKDIGDGPIDALVFAAAVAHYASIDATRGKNFDSMTRVNVDAAMWSLETFLPNLRSAKGSATFISSTLVTRPAPFCAGYAMGKAALEAYVKHAALELAPEIRVNALSLGVVPTQMLSAPRPDGLKAEQRLKQLSSLHPLGLGQVEDAARAIVHLADSRWTTGTTMLVDGGLSL